MIGEGASEDRTSMMGDKHLPRQKKRIISSAYQGIDPQTTRPAGGECGDRVFGSDIERDAENLIL